MATDPGDLVLDPTCGSGTTAYVAEKWGRRWITIGTSRVAVAIARQRILTSTYDHYKLKKEVAGPSGGLVYKTVPHIMLKTIAQNAALDSVFGKHELALAERLDALNGALAQHVTPEIRAVLAAKLELKQRRDGKKSITDVDRRRWLLPKEWWREWEVPFDIDPDWPGPLADALTAYRTAWRAKMNEVNATIAASAEPEDLVDQPEIVRGKTRVSGPFTVEAVMPPEERLARIIHRPQV